MAQPVENFIRRAGLMAGSCNIVLNSLFSWLGNLSMTDVQQGSAAVDTVITSMVMSLLMTLFISVGIGASLARQNGLDPVTTGLLCLMSFMLVAAPVKDGAIEEISLEQFMRDVLPKAGNLEILFKNNLQKNLVSITAPIHDDVAQLFKWDNNFGWSYNGEITDSIRERVKTAGGNINADLRVSLAWFNGDDLDLHSMSPYGHIYFGSKQGLYIAVLEEE